MVVFGKMAHLQLSVDPHRNSRLRAGMHFCCPLKTWAQPLSPSSKKIGHRGNFARRFPTQIAKALPTEEW